MSKVRRILLVAALLASALPLSAPAEARGGVFLGFGVGVPVYPAYPYAYPPPAYYVPPYPAYAAPYPAPYTAYVAPRPVGQACYAGAYVCPLERPMAAGDACACPAMNGQRAWGRVGN
ncbi:hypothetical protein [Muricoccus aerilatus]|uniref:hypothetical protein n=1 Tax=Muricoccus aerilatus TaxID=452982 RepID=UPI0006943EB6|nr:hypothetical protein [Roseomonas aerilata]